MGSLECTRPSIGEAWVGPKSNSLAGSDRFQRVDHEPGLVPLHDPLEVEVFCERDDRDCRVFCSYADQVCPPKQTVAV